MTFRAFPARWKALLSLVILAGMLLTACQADEEIPWATVSVTIAGRTPAPEVTAPATVAPPNTPAPTATSGPALDLRGQTIVFWHPWQGELAKSAQAAADDFNKTNEWGITVKVRPWYSSGALGDAVAAGLKDNAAGLPQVVAAPSEQLAEWSEESKAVVGLDAYLTDPRYGMPAEEIAAFQQAFWAQDQAGNGQFAIPALRNARVLFYNETWSKELGFSGPPKTPAEFKAQACAAAKKNNTSRIQDNFGTGGWIIDDDPLTTLSWMGAFGAQPVPQAVGQPYTFKGKEAESAVAYLRDLLDNGCAWLALNPTPYEYFAKRMALFYSGTLEDIAVQARWNAKIKNEDTWKILPYMSTDGKPVVISGGYSYAIFDAKEEANMAAWLFIRWLEKPTVAVKLAEALPSLPVSSGHAAQLDSQAGSPWKMILPLATPASAGPALASWPEVRRLVEDAAWQIYHTTPENVPKILPELDQAIQTITTP